MIGNTLRTHRIHYVKNLQSSLKVYVPVLERLTSRSNLPMSFTTILAAISQITISQPIDNSFQLQSALVHCHLHIHRAWNYEANEDPGIMDLRLRHWLRNHLWRHLARGHHEVGSSGDFWAKGYLNRQVGCEKTLWEHSSKHTSSTYTLNSYTSVSHSFLWAHTILFCGLVH